MTPTGHWSCWDYAAHKCFRLPFCHSWFELIRLIDSSSNSPEVRDKHIWLRLTMSILPVPSSSSPPREKKICLRLQMFSTCPLFLQSTMRERNTSAWLMKPSSSPPCPSVRLDLPTTHQVHYFTIAAFQPIASIFFLAPWNVFSRNLLIPVAHSCLNFHPCLGRSQEEDYVWWDLS